MAAVATEIPTATPVNVPTDPTVFKPKKRKYTKTTTPHETVVMHENEDGPEIPADIIDVPTKKAKKPKTDEKPKVMSSSIPNMTVGDVRKCLNQIRKAGANIRENHLLANGWPAGRFALMYLMGNYSSKKRRGAGSEDDEEDGDEHPSDAEPKSG